MSLSKYEYGDFKLVVEKLVHKYTTRDRSAVASLIIHSVDSGTDKRKLEDKLLSFVDKSLAYKLADKTFMELDNLGIKISKKRNYKKEEDDGSTESKRAKAKTRNDSEKLPLSLDPEIKTEIEKMKLDIGVPGQIQAQQIKDLMAKAQATIEERKKALAIQGPVVNTILNGAELDASARIAQLQARIQAKFETTDFLIPPPPPGLANIPIFGFRMHTGVALGASSSTPGAAKPTDQSKPTPLILDAEGRTVDMSGKEVHLTQRIPTLKANIRAKKREEFKQQLLEKPVEESSESQFFDYRVPSKPFIRTKKAFKFHDPGKYIQLAKRERAKSRLEKLQEAINQVAKKTGISSAAKLAQLEQREQKGSDLFTPDAEWWDSIILEYDRYPVEGEPVKLKEDFITSLVEHPMEMKCSTDPSKSIELQVFMTKEERKKLRRLNRREMWKEKQEKIRLGLEPPPEPKVRMANLMRVLGTEAVIDPTKMEKHVREQMAKRLKAHEDANLSRKLTPEQKREKKVRKIKEDTAGKVNVAVFRVTDLSNGSHKFKIEMNAKQLFMTGIVILYKDVNVVVVEGGPKQQKKYKRLMMERIKWVEESRCKDPEVEPKCELIWEGVAQERSFGEMQFKTCPSETFARDHFIRHNLEHFWDLAYGKKLLEETEGL